MPSDSPRQTTHPIAADAEAEARDARVSILIVVTIASLLGAAAAGGALALSRDGRHAFEIVVPATIIGAVEAWMSRSGGRAEEGGDTKGRHWLASVGRGALLGAALGVLADAFKERVFPALARVLAPSVGRVFAAMGAPLDESTEHGLAYVVAIGAFVLIAFTVRALRRTVRQYPQ